MEVYQAVEGVGTDEGVAVGDILLPVSGLPFMVFLGVVFTVELSEGDCLCIILMPSVKFLDALLVLCLLSDAEFDTKILPISQMPKSAPMPVTIGGRRFYFPMQCGKLSLNQGITV